MNSAINVYSSDNICLGNIRACLDFPACGYHDKKTILFAGWVLPIDPVNHQINVKLIIEENGQIRTVDTTRVMRPDVIIALLPHASLPEDAKKVGFSAKVQVNCSAKISIIIVDGQRELSWMNADVVQSKSISNFVDKLKNTVQNGSLNGSESSEIDLDEINKSIKVYHPHTICSLHKSVNHEHIKSIINSVDNHYLINALFTSTKGIVQCNKSNLQFKIIKSKTINGHNILFCQDGNILFIIHQHVTSLDGVYYPESGIFLSYCHNSANELNTINRMILSFGFHSASSDYRFTAFLIGHGRPYHYLYDGMLGLENIYRSNGGFHGGNKFYMLQENAFIDAVKIYNNTQNTIVVNNNELTKLENDGVIFIKIGSYFGHGANQINILDLMREVDERILKYIGSTELFRHSKENKIRKNFPVLWLGVTGQKRAWIEQVEGYANIINKIYQSFPGMAIVFDGWTSTLVPNERDKIESVSDRKITSAIKELIPDDIAIIDLIGATVAEKIHTGMLVDCAIVNYATGSMNISRICGRPCVTHMNNSFQPARAQHIHKNAYHIKDEFVTDVLANDSRIDSTSYHINWNHIYDALIQLMGQQNVINNRY